jgi:F-type H+-transporting ATPase subunit alpha
MVELLKQDQYVPMTVDQQIVVIFAGTSGYLDEVPVNAVKRFEAEMLKFVASKYADLLKDITAKKQLDEDLKSRLKSAIEEFKKTFTA